jgi:hypothetical protein
MAYIKTAEARSLSEIAAEIRADWGPKVNFGAKPYLDAMQSLQTMDDMYGMDDASSIVAYFLSNANTWRGETAKRVKTELKAMLKGVYGSKQADSGLPHTYVTTYDGAVLDVHHSHFGGQFVATCERCGIVIALWDDEEELKSHVCDPAGIIAGSSKQAEGPPKLPEKKTGYCTVCSDKIEHDPVSGDWHHTGKQYQGHEAVPKSASKEAKRVYRYEPVGLDQWDPKPHQPAPGTLVVKTSGGPGTPKNGTMGFTYVEDAETGQFYGLVLLNSLQPTSNVESMRKGAPFANYKDFADCVSKNSDKDDPNAYCGKIKHETEDKSSSKEGKAMNSYYLVDKETGTPVAGPFKTAEIAESVGTVNSRVQPVDDPNGHIAARVSPRVYAASRKLAGEVPPQFKDQQKGDSGGDSGGDSKGGSTCSVCGDAIEADPEGGGYHHDNGEKHDHEAKPGKSSARKLAEEKYDKEQGGGAESGLPTVGPGHEEDTPAWPYDLAELPDQPGEAPSNSGSGAADVASTPTPGDANGYPQPKGGDSARQVDPWPGQDGQSAGIGETKSSRRDQPRRVATPERVIRASAAIEEVADDDIYLK